MSHRDCMRLLAGAALLWCLPNLAGCNSCNPPTTSWLMWRNDQFRSATQLFETALNDPNAVSTLHVAWTFKNGGPRGFRASPVVFNDGTVFVGDSNGYFYALAGNDGHKLWQFPPQGQLGLTQQFDAGMSTPNPSVFGIASSAALTTIGTTRAVIFGAPDQSSGSHLGDGHLFALDMGSGKLIWESPPIALLTGLSDGSTSEFHQQIGYSSPLVFND